MKRQLKAIFHSSTISTNSESMDVKSEPVFYLNKGTDGRYQDSVDSSRDAPVNVQRMVIEVAEISIQRMATDIIETSNTEVAAID